MLLPAQCEKAVTIPELMGRPGDGLRVREGSKTPPVSGVFELRAYFRLVSGFSEACACDVFRLVFSGLQAKKAGRLVGFGGAAYYPPYRQLLSTQRARFGPNFVTILPTGVCLCST